MIYFSSLLRNKLPKLTSEIGKKVKIAYLQNTKDIFSKLSYKLGKSLRFNASYWTVANHRKIFDRRYMYWNEGQNELFRDTDRYTLEVNHNVTPRLFYTLRYSKFNQAKGYRLTPKWFSSNCW